MKAHPKLGFDWLTSQNEFPAETLDAVLSHHECLDGSGYPYGLAGSQISDLVRITTIADIYAALTEDRSYHVSRSPMQTYNMMIEMGRKIDQQLLAAFRPVAEGLQIA